jgi:hypothetical protein
MHPLNWVIIVGWLAYVVTHGLRRSRGTKGIEGYFLANRSLPWWAVGLVMATQLSAVTMIGTTGQGATDGMRFIQFYFRIADRDGDLWRHARSFCTARVARRTSISNGASTPRPDRSRRSCS